nr:MAG TPA: hypothetical protein [Caudoviricetes sp.]
MLLPVANLKSLNLDYNITNSLKKNLLKVRALSHSFLRRIRHNAFKTSK